MTKFGCLSEALSEFNKYFLKLESLSLIRTEIKHYECIQKLFPNLRYFEVRHKRICRCDHWWNDHNNWCYSLTNVRLKRFIELDMLDISHDLIYAFGFEEYSIQINSDFLNHVNTTLPNLNYLLLNLTELSGFEIPSSKENFKNLKGFSVNVEDIAHLR